MAASTAQFLEAFNTSNIDLLDSVFIQTEKASWISAFGPFRVDGWDDVRSDVFARLLSLPPGAVNLAVRQARIDMLGDDAAVSSTHWVLTIRPPGAAPITYNGRSTSVRELVDGEWLYVHGHTSLLPE